VSRALRYSAPLLQHTTQMRFGGAGGVSWDTVQQVGIAAIRSVAQAATLAMVGVYMGKTGVMTREVTKALSTLSMQITVPALLFSNALQTDLSMLVRAWPMLFFPFIYSAVGAL
jgi:hypothetical protein